MSPSSIPRRREALLTIQRASRASHIPPDRKLRAWASAALPKKAEVTVRYVASDEARRLNRRFRGKDYATNVLSFPYDGAARGTVAGDIVICAPVVAREAREQSKSLEAHHAHLLLHGLLHLRGYDHEREPDARRMERRERQLLAKFGFPDPY